MRLKRSKHGITERFVHVHERQDGTDHVFFSPPPESRPADWPATHVLPRLGEQVGSLSDGAFRRAVLADAELLNKQLDRRMEQNRVLAGVKRYDMPSLFEVYRKSQRYKKLCDDSRKKNEFHMRYILKWSKSANHPDVREMSGEHVEDFLAVFDDREPLQVQIRSTLNILFKQAKKARWLKDNPIADIEWTPPESRLQNLWSQENIDTYVAASINFGHLGLAAFLLAEWEVGQRLNDMRDARYGYKYIDGHFRVQQNKVKRTTKKKVQLPVTPKVIEAIERARIEGCDYVFPDTVAGRPFSYDRLRRRFEHVRCAVAIPGEPHLLLQTLRHSCVVHMARAEEPLADIAQITGHSLVTVDQIMEKYLVRTDERGAEVKKRMNRKAGGRDSDFRPRPEEGAWKETRERGRIVQARHVDPDDPETSIGALANAITDRFMLPRGSI